MADQALPALKHVPLGLISGGSWRLLLLFFLPSLFEVDLSDRICMLYVGKNQPFVQPTCLGMAFLRGSSCLNFLLEFIYFVNICRFVRIYPTLQISVNKFNHFLSTDVLFRTACGSLHGLMCHLRCHIFVMP